jgi:hypothetical protein
MEKGTNGEGEAVLKRKGGLFRRIKGPNGPNKGQCDHSGEEAAGEAEWETSTEATGWES